MHRTPRFTIYFDATSGAGSGAPATPATPASPPSPSPSPGPASTTTPSTPASPPGVPGAPGAPAAPAKTFEFAEDRTTWVDPTKYTAAEQRAIRAEAEAKRFRAMLEAGTGVTLNGPAEPEDPQILAARDTILNKILPPGMKRVLEAASKNPEAFERLLADGPRAVQGYASAQEARGVEFVDAVFSGLAKDLGVTQLSARQASLVGDAFVSWVRSDAQLLGRYGRGDKTITTEFLNDWRAGFIDPLRRTAQASGAAVAGQNRNLPPGPRGTGAAPTTRGPIQPKTEDEVHEAAARMWEAARAAQQ